jgi:hypothetical protein
VRPADNSAESSPVTDVALEEIGRRMDVDQRLLARRERMARSMCSVVPYRLERYCPLRYEEHFAGQVRLSVPCWWKSLLQAPRPNKAPGISSVSLASSAD